MTTPTWQAIAPPALRDASPLHRLGYTISFVFAVLAVALLVVVTGALTLGCSAVPGAAPACKAIEIADDVCEILVRVPDPATGKMTQVRVPAAALRREGARALSGGTPPAGCAP